MSYDIVFGPNALDELDWIPEEAVDKLDRRLRRLAKDPVKLSEPAAFPDPCTGQKYTFRCRAAGRRFEFVAYFYYRENEREICIVKVTGAVILE